MAYVFVKAALLAFGGGFAAVPLIQHEVVNVYGWLTTKQFADGVALGQITPGPIAITATFIGYVLDGMRGALIATAAMFLPGALLMGMLAGAYQRFRGSRQLQATLKGILAGFVGMLGVMVVRFGQAGVTDVPTALLGAAALVGLTVFKVQPVYVILVGVAVSVILFR